MNLQKHNDIFKELNKSNIRHSKTYLQIYKYSDNKEICKTLVYFDDPNELNKFYTMMCKNSKHVIATHNRIKAKQINKFQFDINWLYERENIITYTKENRVKDIKYYYYVEFPDIDFDLVLDILKNQTNNIVDNGNYVVSCEI